MSKLVYLDVARVVHYVAVRQSFYDWLDGDYGYLDGAFTSKYILTKAAGSSEFAEDYAQLKALVEEHGIEYMELYPDDELE